MTAPIPVASCPLCGTHEFSPHSVPGPNLYSEMLAGLVGMPEAALLDEVRNVVCRQCGLIFKRAWPPADVLRRLFAECVPSHPRGWDVRSGRFSAASFQAEVAAYRQAIDDGDGTAVNRYRRALTSIVDAIPELDGDPVGQRLREAVALGDVAALEAADPLLRQVMREPRPYGRFSGFSSLSLWRFVAATVGEILSYAEVGCPLWGLLPRAQEHGCLAVYLRRVEPNYWSGGCRRGGLHCSDQLVASSPVAVADWQDLPGRTYDAIGAFQYLDHLERPGEFMAELFERSRAAVIILDAADEPVSVQHFTGWTTGALAWLADRHGCEIHADFTEIRPSGNRLVLLTQS
jgi:hypothetical protein